MALFGIPNRSPCLSQILSNLRSRGQDLCSQIIKIEETDGAAYEMQRINETVQERVLDGKHIVSDPVR